MKNPFIDTVVQYLTISTNYAVIINGKFGIGKTYFFKNVLVPYIKNKKIKNSKGKEFIPIYISLFGVKSLSDIQLQILLELQPVLKGKKVKLATGLGKLFATGISNFIGFGNLKEYTDILTDTSTEFIDYNQFLICFDDFDRRSSSLDLSEVFGFINSLVEHDNCKVLMIADEIKLQKDDNSYIGVKEKVIGTSVVFKQTISQVFDSIVMKYQAEGDNSFYEFLETKRLEIIKGIESNESNLRNLLFFLEHFKTIYYLIKKDLDSDPVFEFYKNEKWDSIFKFVFSISIEYRNSRLTKENLKWINVNFSYYTSVDFEKNQFEESYKVKSEKSFSQEFLRKYYPMGGFLRYKSILEHLIGEKPFIAEQLKSELKIAFNELGDETAREIAVIRELAYKDVLGLSDKEHRILINEMLIYIDNGYYTLEEYPTFFVYCIRFNNVLNFNIEKLQKRFKKGINKSMQRNEHIEELSIVFPTKGDNYWDDTEPVVLYCIKVNNQQSKQEQLIRITDMTKLFRVDFDVFISKIQDANLSYLYEPFWSAVPLNNIYRVINKLDNYKLIVLGKAFKKRYNISNAELLKPERDVLKKIIIRINKPKRRRVKNLRNAALDILIENLRDSISTLERINVE